MDTKQIKRIQTMERALEESAGAVEALDAALERYEEVLPKIHALTEYYENGMWTRDYQDDDAGKLPENLNRAVLTQDAVFDLLGDVGRLQDTMGRLGSRTRRTGRKRCRRARARKQGRLRG